MYDEYFSINKVYEIRFDFHVLSENTITKVINLTRKPIGVKGRIAQVI